MSSWWPDVLCGAEQPTYSYSGGCMLGSLDSNQHSGRWLTVFSSPLVERLPFSPSFSFTIISSLCFSLCLCFSLSLSLSSMSKLNRWSPSVVYRLLSSLAALWTSTRSQWASSHIPPPSLSPHPLSHSLTCTVCALVFSISTLSFDGSQAHTHTERCTSQNPYNSKLCTHPHP